ncbi:glycoside hydrolase family 43 protein [Mucilaginibacter robiniae]|uniref:Glycoside hydrolase family 43 protein n=1 Tax=Mucilaginibacter robiniae TaxID=2728022 RepID=A0A7L5E4J8_9SPHI|nr:glycoside hydrolase family 43 protein [Mucilaginibacter robiniae]QJD97229.1 glycoside hydrolase family 43 protein [Mucilaginibacter robiniae]
MPIKKLSFLLVIIWCCTLPTWAQSTRLVNPILAGFYPDPSILKVGKDYYLINSTFAYFPGIPIFHSKDLKNWKQIGNVIDRPTQMNFMGDRMTRGLFAPAISYHNGIYYITCTLIDHKGNFVVTAKNPTGPWSDPVWLPSVSGIDPSLFFDDNKAYLVYNSDAPDNKPLYSGHRTIKIYEFDPVKMQMMGEPQIVVNGGVDISKKPVWIEGPHIIKANNWYYLYAAEGGTSVNHSEVVFRSRSVTGLYVPYEHNPILTQRSLPPERPNPITSAGHAQFVEGPDGKTYAVFLAVRPYADDYYNTGRETFIAPVKWTNDWPIINADFKEVRYTYTAPYQEVKQQNTLPQSGNFSYTLNFKNGIDPSLLFLRTYDSSWLKTDAHGLTMKLKPETCMDFGNAAFVGKRQQHLICSASTELNFVAANDHEKAGMLIFQDEKHFYYICKSIADGKPVMQLYQSNSQSAGNMNLLAQAPLKGTGAKVYLQIKASGAQYSFYYSEQPNNWQLLKDGIDGKFLSTHEAGGFIGCLFALYATSSGMASTSTANYPWLRYEGNDVVYKQ